jgi:flagellar capping protein FliD
MFHRIVFYKEDIKLNGPISGTVSVSVKSDKYAAKSSLDLHHKDFVKFFNDLIELWKSLKSETIIIKEPYGYQQYIEIKSSKGKFIIKGKLVDVGNRSFRIDFEQVLDQSYMIDFIQMIQKFNIENHTV